MELRTDVMDFGYSAAVQTKHGTYCCRRPRKRQTAGSAGVGSGKFRARSYRIGNRYWLQHTAASGNWV
jgi:hypothetical protein